MEGGPQNVAEALQLLHRECLQHKLNLVIREHCKWHDLGCVTVCGAMARFRWPGCQSGVPVVVNRRVRVGYLSGQIGESLLG